MKRLLVLICGIALVAAPLSADALTWVLQGVMFTDGGTAAGSFVYDTASVVSNVQITTTAGSVLPGATYIHSPVWINAAIAVTTTTGPDHSGMPGMFLFFTPALGLDPLWGGGVSLVGSPEGTCTSAGCTGLTVRRSVTAGIATPGEAPIGYFFM